MLSSWIFDCYVLLPSLDREFQSLLNHPTLHFMYCDDFIVPLTLIVRMDETHIDVTNLEDVPVVYDDDISELQAQLTRIRDLKALSVFSDDSVCIDVLQSSPVRSPLHLALLSSDPHEPLRSPFTDGRPTTAATVLGIPSVSSSSVRDSMWEELFRELKQEIFVEMCSELFRSQQKIVVVQQENAMFRNHIEELESVLVRASTPDSPSNMSLDQPAGILDSHLLDPVVFLTQMGNFTEDETSTCCHLAHPV